jgi:Rod binding domain-containing protein
MNSMGSIADCGLRTADLSQVANLPSTSPDRSEQKTQQVAKDFESVLLSRLFEQVQKTIGSWDSEDDGTGQQVQGLFWLYLARDVADRGGVGLWKDIYQQLQQMDGAPNPAEVLNEEL